MTVIRTAKSKPEPRGKSTLSGPEIRLIISHIESWDEQRREALAGIQAVYAEARRCGYDVKTLRQLVQMRNLGSAGYLKREVMIGDYWLAAGKDIWSTPMVN